jgi:two-component system sensor histidine kinase AlgZ
MALGKIPSQQSGLFFFKHWGKWSYVIELLIACNLLALIMVLASTPELRDFSWLYLLQQMCFVSWIALCFSLCVTRLPSRWQQLPPINLLLLCLLVLILLIMLSTALLNGLSLWLNQSPGHTGPYSIWSGSGSRVLQGVAIGALCLRYVYIRDQWTKRRQSELLAKVQALQARIHPHFLFNSLNSVVSLISIDPTKAEQMLLDLSSLFRASLTELKEVSLHEEISLCQRYLQIESLRLGERLRVNWKIDSVRDLRKVRIPLLTLQPLLENCIYHGVESLTEASVVNILIEVSGQRVNIVLTNPYQAALTENQGHGIAIDNVKQRLIAHYGSSVYFSMHARHGHFTMLLSYQWL